MPTYLVLGSFTEQGIRSVRDSLMREDAFRKQCEKVGAQVKDVYRTMGRYDLAAVVNAPDDLTMSSLLYSTGALGNIRTETLRAFTRQETEQVLAKCCSATTKVIPGRTARPDSTLYSGHLKVRRCPMLRRIMGVAFVIVLLLALAAPASAGRGHGGGFRGGFHGGFHGGGLQGGFHNGFHHHHGFHHHGFHHHPGFHRFGCCFGPVFVGGVFVGAAVAAPYYAYPYSVYAAPAYEPAPVYQAPAPPAPPVVCYASGCYHLQGNGVSVPYQWVWVPAVPAPPPGPPNG